MLQFKQKLAEVTSESRDREDDLERLRGVAEALVQSPKTGDASRVQDTMRRLEQSWRELDDMLSDKRKEAGVREEQSSRCAISLAKKLTLCAHPKFVYLCTRRVILK